MTMLPDLPSWAWLIVALIGAIALVLPFWMLWRIPVYRRMARVARARGPVTHTLFWLLFVGSYLLVVWVLVWFYGKSL